MFRSYRAGDGWQWWWGSIVSMTAIKACWLLMTKKKNVHSIAWACSTCKLTCKCWVQRMLDSPVSMSSPPPWDVSVLVTWGFVPCGCYYCFLLKVSAVQHGVTLRNLPDHRQADCNIFSAMEKVGMHGVVVFLLSIPDPFFSSNRRDYSDDDKNLNTNATLCFAFCLNIPLQSQCMGDHFWGICLVCKCFN